MVVVPWILDCIYGGWKLFLRHQSKWIQEIFTYSHIESIADLMSLITSSDTLIAVSDGSAIETTQLSSFGWVLTNQEGLKQFEGNGPCDGKATSMRAEAMGMLAISVVIGKIHEFTNYTCDTLNVQFYADNLALTNRMTEHQQYDSIYINSYLDPDIDLTEEIHFCHKEHKITATFTHGMQPLPIWTSQPK